tara:strand:- start:107 stop:304 length:198 start_codon:yes stop_codon:yes gene_type:complete
MTEKKKNWFFRQLESPKNSAALFMGLAIFGGISQGGEFLPTFIAGIVGGGIIGLIVHYIYKFFTK